MEGFAKEKALERPASSGEAVSLGGLPRPALPGAGPPIFAYCIANTVRPGARAGEFLLGADEFLMFAAGRGRKENRVSFEDSVDCPAANKRDRPADAKRCDGPFGSRRQSEKAKPERPVPPKRQSNPSTAFFGGIKVPATVKMSANSVNLCAGKDSRRIY